MLTHEERQAKISVKGEDGQVVPGWTFQWIPAAQKVQFEDGTWGNPPSSAMDELTRVTRGVAPLPASKLRLPEPVKPAEIVAPHKAPPPADDEEPVAMEHVHGFDLIEPAAPGLGGPARPARGIRDRRVRSSGCVRGPVGVESAV